MSNLYLVRGLYKVARGWHEAGNLDAARKLYGFILDIQDRGHDLRSIEFALSQAAMAQLAALDEQYLEAEHMYIKALAMCVDCCGETSIDFARILRDYAQLLRRMHMVLEAQALEGRADSIAKLELPALTA
jgi:hypothetical protein